MPHPVYEGRQVIQPEQLAERDSVALAFPYGANGIRIPIQKLRDRWKKRQRRIERTEKTR